ncbi:MAG: DUF4349 domain-containing protein [bacterium]|jgi:hypothetical protein
MECKAAQELMSDYLDDELSEEERIRLDEHLRACSRCADELAELRTVVSLCRSLPAVEPPAVFREQLYRRLAAEIGPEKKSLWQIFRDWARRGTYRSVAAVFASAIIFIFSLNGVVALRYDNPLLRLAGYGQQTEEIPPADVDAGDAEQYSRTKDFSAGIQSLQTGEAPVDVLPPGEAEGGMISFEANGADTSELTTPDGEAVAPEEPANGGAALTSEEMQRMLEAPPGMGGNSMMKATAPAPTRGMRMVHRVRIVLAVEDMAASHNRVEEITAANGGTISNITYRYGADKQEDGRQIDLQIPEAVFTPALAELEGIGRITSKEMSEVNVTVQAAAAENRLTNINRQAETLHNLRSNAPDELTLVQIDNELDFIRNEAEVLLLAIDNLNNAQIETILVPEVE